ncbi:MAG: hypothetical protein K0U59_06075 [Gammaproteobacteria bacterium]|nr:hypothetical protein [Gammaproteobacteria bacterium]
MDHVTGTVLAYVFGKRKNKIFKKLKALLEPFGIQRYYSDDWGAYDRHLDGKQHTVGKRNIQKIERKNLNFRTWIKRLTGDRTTKTQKILSRGCTIVFWHQINL